MPKIKITPAQITAGGFILVAVGSFLPWVSTSGFLGIGGSQLLGARNGEGAVSLIAGVLCIAALFLFSSETAFKKGIFVSIMGLLILALVIEFIVGVKDSLGAGVWVTLAGGLVAVIAGILEYNTAKSNRSA
jgi:hypothetical protein